MIALRDYIRNRRVEPADEIAPQPGSLGRQHRIWGMIFVAPAVLGFVLWQFGPMMASLVISFTDWHVARSPNWIGLQNFERMFTSDALFFQSLQVTAIYSFASIPLRLVFAFALAMLLNEKVRGLSIFRTIFYVPSMVPLIASSVIWLWLFNPELGLFNAFLDAVGLPKIQWIYDSSTALPSLIVMSLWDVGPMMIVFLAGLQGVPRHLYEAVDVDGGNAWHRLRYVTVPMVTPVILFNMILAIIGTMQTFIQPYVMTQGGPNNSTLFYVLYLYRQAFVQGDMGYASALGWVLFVIIAILSVLVFRSQRRWVYYEGGDR